MRLTKETSSVMGYNMIQHKFLQFNMLLTLRKTTLTCCYKEVCHWGVSLDSVDESWPDLLETHMSHQPILLCCHWLALE